MKNIVIAGAGPMGLYLGMRLKQLGVKNVTVIDPRAHKFTRPGILNRNNFEALGVLLKEKIETPDFHIKAMQNTLYALAGSEKFKVELKPAAFVDFKTTADAKLITVKDEKQTYDLPCDLLFDATGPARVILTRVNELADYPFQLEHVADNPIKNHFLAYVKLTKADAAFLQSWEKERNDPNYVQEKFREHKLDKFGWKEIVEPAFVSVVVKEAKDKLYKVCFYYEIPPGLDEDKHEAWLKELLYLKTGADDIEFHRVKEVAKSGAKKPVFAAFVMDPTKVTPAFFESKDLPVVLPVGDAQMEADYRVGIGTTEGAKRIEALLDAMKIENGEIVAIDYQKYEQNLIKLMQETQSELENLYAERRYEISQQLALAKHHFRKKGETGKELVDDIVVRQNFQKNYKLGLKFYDEALKELSKGNLALTVKTIELFQEAEKCYVQAKQQLSLLKPEDVKESTLSLERAFHNLALQYIKAATRYQSPEVQLNYYHSALRILNQHLPKQYGNEIVKLYEKIIAARIQAGAFAKAIKAVDEVQQKLPDFKFSQLQKIKDKFNFQKVIAIVNLPVHAVNKKHYEEARQILAELERNESIPKEKIKGLVNKLNDCAAQIQDVAQPAKRKGIFRL